MTAQRRPGQSAALVAVFGLLVLALGGTWLASSAGAADDPTKLLVDTLSGSSQTTQPAPSTSTTIAPTTAQPHRSTRHASGAAVATSSTTTSVVPGLAAAIAQSQITGSQVAVPISSYSRPRYPASAVIPPGGVWPAEDGGVPAGGVLIIALLSAVAGGALVVAAYRRRELVAWAMRRRESAE